MHMHCGNSSVGRAQPCQGWGREFESRFPLQILGESQSAGWQNGDAAACKAVYAGSIPASASRLTYLDFLDKMIL